MKNYVSSGAHVTLPAPAAVTSGAAVLLGALFGVAQADAAPGAPLVLVTTGIFDLPKIGAQAWAPGDRIYWDSAAGLSTIEASGNSLIGVAVAAVGAGLAETLGRVRLNGVVG